MSASFSPQDPITRETFPAVWQYTRKKYVRSKKGRAARGPISFCSQFLFFACFVVLSYGALYHSGHPVILNILNRAPALVSFWNQFAALLYGGKPGTPGLSLLFLLGVPIAVSLVIFLAVQLLYHPRAPELPQGEDRQAQALQTAAHQIKRDRKETYRSSGGITVVFFALLVVVFVILYYVFFHYHPTKVDPLHATGTRGPLYVVLGGFAVILIYWICSLVMSLVLRPLHTVYVPKAYFQNVDDFCDRPRPAASAAPVEAAAPAEVPEAPENPQS